MDEGGNAGGKLAILRNFVEVVLNYAGLSTEIQRHHLYDQRSTIDEPLEARMAVFVQCHDFAIKNCRLFQPC